MGAAQRKIEGEVTRVLYDHECKVLERGHDGAGHQTIVFLRHDQRVVFHYANTICLNGHSLKNVIARLRRIIREIPEPPPMPVVILPPEVDAEKAMEALPVAPPPTPPNPKRMTKERRKELAKIYLSLGSLELTSAKTGVEQGKLSILIFSQRGQAAEHLHREINKAKMEASRKLREAANSVEVDKPMKGQIELVRWVPRSRERVLNGIPKAIPHLASFEKRCEIAYLFARGSKSVPQLALSTGRPEGSINGFLRKEFGLPPASKRKRFTIAQLEERIRAAINRKMNE